MTQTLAATLVLIFSIITIWAYVVAWRGATLGARRVGSLVIAAIAALIGFVVTFGLAIPLLDDFHNPAVPLSEALVGCLVLWVIAAVPWVVAARCALFAFRKEHPGDSSR